MVDSRWSGVNWILVSHYPRFLRPSTIDYRPLTNILVTSCICTRTPFERLLPLAREAGWTLEDLMRETGCGEECGLCRPYLRRMLQTGETTFRELLPD